MTPETQKIDASLQKLSRSTNWFSTLLVLAVAVVFASSVWTNYKVITLTSGLRQTQNQLSAEQRRSADQTTAARFASCHQYNHQQDLQVDAEKTEIRFAVNQLTAHSTRPGISQDVTAFLEGYDTTVRNSHKPRDCSAAGIAKYLGLPTKG